jgi:hypothetical protein
MMPKNNAALLVDVAFVVASIFEREGVSYTIHHGSLLGATRLKGLLPWDIDFDLFVLTDKGRRFDVERLSRACSEHGLQMDEIERGQYFTIRPALRMGRKLVRLFPVIEVDILKSSQNERGEAVYDQSTAHRKWEGGELEPLKRYPYHGSWLLGPNNPEPVLVRLYQNASSAAAMQSFDRASLPCATDLFWSHARPLGGETDWARVSERAKNIRKMIVWRCVYCAPWYLLNSLYCITIQTLRRKAGGHIE